MASGLPLPLILNGLPFRSPGVPKLARFLTFPFFPHSGLAMGESPRSVSLAVLPPVPCLYIILLLSDPGEPRGEPLRGVEESW